MKTAADKDCRFQCNVAPDGVAQILMEGDWLWPAAIGRILPEASKTVSVTVDASRVGKWNSSFMVFLYRLQKECKSASLPLDFKSLPDGADRLLRLSAAGGVKKFEAASKSDPITRLGEFSLEVLTACRTGVEFLGELLIAFFKLVRGRARMRWGDVWTEIIKAGPKALFIVSLIGFLMGLILAFIGAIPLKWFRAEVYVASLIGIGMLRLMAAVMAGTVMAGRTGAAYAAELGTMQVNEEIDALESMGIPPMEFLVLPRTIALTLMLPMLCVYADIVGVFGGLVVGVFYLKLTVVEYWQQLVDTTRMSDLFVGLFTSFVFAILIAICGCLRGLHCGRSSAAVGQATTAAMVSSLVCLVIATSIITIVTVSLDI